jgi:hypothetical protein
MDIKVLVMCQRKKSYEYISKPNNIAEAIKVDMTVKNIEKYLYNYYGTNNIIIEYMIEQYKDKDLYDADYKIWFEPTSKDNSIRIQSYDFISSHRDMYDMVMLQTCPLMHFTQNFKYLPLIMKDTGILTLKAFTYLDEDIKITRNKIIPEVYETLTKYFVMIDDDDDSYKLLNKE